MIKKTARIFGIVIGFSALALVAQEKEGATAHKIFAPADIQWGDAPPGLPTGAKMAVLDGDPGKTGSFTVRLKSPDGYKISPHTHPSAERVTVISGLVRIGMGEKFDQTATREMAPGTFTVLPVGMPHFVWTTGETVVQIQSEGPFEIKYINSADDPRNAKK